MRKNRDLKAEILSVMWKFPFGTSLEPIAREVKAQRRTIQHAMDALERDGKILTEMSKPSGWAWGNVKSRKVYKLMRHVHD